MRNKAGLSVLITADTITVRCTTRDRIASQIRIRATSGVITREQRRCPTISFQTNLTRPEDPLIRQCRLHDQVGVVTVAVSLRKMSIVGASVGCIACALTWLVMSEHSPLFDYFLKNPTFVNFWGKINFLAFVFALVLHLPDTSATGFLIVFVQWFIFGSVAYVTYSALSSTGDD